MSDGVPHPLIHGEIPLENPSEPSRPNLTIAPQNGEVPTTDPPISMLPAEALCDIFLMAQAMSRVNGVPENPLVEVIVSQVCTQWRAIAISLPHLWTSFRFKYTVTDPRMLPYDRIEAYLERSKPMLLDNFYLNFGFIKMQFPHEQLHRTLLWSLISHADRWRHISFISLESSAMPELHKQLRLLEVPHLESFTMCPFQEKGDEEENEQLVANLDPQIFIGGARKLSYARIDSPLFMPPLSNITVIRLEKHNLQRYRWLSWNAFQQMMELPFLTSLSICATVVAYMLDDDHPWQIKAPKLKNLRIGDEKVFALRLLSHLSAPALENLALYNLSEDQWSPILLPITQPIFPTIRVLGLLDVVVRSSEVDFIRSMAPKVEHLIMSRDPGDKDQLLDRLRAESCWPLLREFTSDGSNPIKGYVSFAFARKLHGFPLRTIRVNPKQMSFWKKSRVLKGLQKYCDVVEPFTNQFQFEIWPFPESP